MNTCLLTQQPGVEIKPLKCYRKRRLSQRRRLLEKKQTNNEGRQAINNMALMRKHGMMHDNLMEASN